MKRLLLVLLLALCWLWSTAIAVGLRMRGVKRAIFAEASKAIVSLRAACSPAWSVVQWLRTAHGKLFARRVLVGLLLVAAIAAPAAAAFDTTGLVSHWKLDEASGSAVDAHGSNNLTETSGTIASTTGKVNNARDFESGDTEYFTIADNAGLSTGNVDWTICCWVNAESLGANRFIVGKTNDASQCEWTLVFNNTNNRFELHVSSNGSNDTTRGATTFGAPSTGTWYFVVAWHDSVNDTINIQVNNGTVDSSSYSTGTFDSTSPFQIGARNAAEIPWDGLIDEVSFFKRVLTTYERTALYNSGSGLAYPWTGAALPTAFTTSDIAPYSYGRFNDGVANAARYAFVASGSRAHFRITGTEATLYCNGSSTAPFSISVDGGSATSPTISGGLITLFTGLSDTAHLVDIKINDAYVPSGGWFVRPKCLDVVGSSPAVSADPNYGPVQLLSQATLGQVTTGAYTSNSYTSPNGQTDRGAEGISIRGKAERIYVWVGSTFESADTLTLLIDGVHSVTTTVSPTTAEFRWVLLTTGLDVSTEHEYTIIHGGGVTASNRAPMDAVMFGGSGAQFSASAVTTRKRIAGWGDSILEGSDADGTTLWRSRGFFGRTCEILGALPHNRGIAGNNTAHVDARITSELSAIVTAPGEPDLILIGIGRNDWLSGDFAAVKTSYRSVVDKAIAGSTLCPIICLENWNQTANTGRSTVNTLIAQVVSEVANARVHLVDTDAGPTLNATHPTQAECATMATYLAPLLQPYLSSGGGARYYQQQQANWSRTLDQIAFHKSSISNRIRQGRLLEASYQVAP